MSNHHNHQGCCESHGNHKDSCCHEHECSHEHHHESFDFHEELLELADEAWMEVLKEKIMENIRSNCPSIDELAKIVSEGNNKRWASKMAARHECESLKQKIHNHFRKKDK